MTYSTSTDRTMEQKACLAFVFLSVAIGVIGFWTKGWLPGLLLTVAMGVTVFLLSRAVERVQEAWTKNYHFTAIVAGILGFGFAMIEANLNHIGLDHLNATYQLAPADYLWPACWFVSGVNIFATFAFARDLPKTTTTTQPAEDQPAAKPSADVLVFGPNLQERRTLQEIGDRLRAQGAM